MGHLVSPAELPDSGREPSIDDEQMRPFIRAFINAVRVPCLCAVVAVGAGACRSPGYVASAVPKDSVAKLDVVSIQEAFAHSQTLHKGVGSRIFLSPGQVPTVRFGTIDLLTVPLVIDNARPHTIKVRSYVLRKTDGSFVLFYPLLSLVDEAFQAYRTVKPKYEFAFENSVLINEFEIPAGINRVLIRTDEEFLRGSFIGRTEPGAPSQVAQTAATVIGGAIGTVVFVWTTKGESHEFRLGEVGVIDVESD